uniref:Kell metallo-endopeptidase (Kell blood group) n=1 Tax=Cyprinodon variegatus TaxID=28743 RepID=A0A3Q2FC58_CYPVA
CVSSACQWAAARLSMSTDPFTQPCDYFMSPCGSKGSPLKSRGGQRSSAVRKTKDFYHSCLDTKSLETAGAEPFLELIQKLGGWAVSGQWNKTDFNYTLGLLMREYGTFPFFNLYIDQPDLLIPIEWNSEKQQSRAKAETIRPFLSSCQSYLAFLGSPPSNRLFHVGTFISLSSELAVATSPVQYRRLKGQLFQRMTIRELQSQAPAIDWLGCLQAAFHPLSLSEDDQVLLHNLPYIIQMSKIINRWLQKPFISSSFLETYMFLNLLHTLMPAMDSRFSETAKNMSLALGNVEEEVPRWKHCLLETETGFDTVLTHLLSERMARQKTEEIIENVFFSFISKIMELKWKDHKPFQHFIDKKQKHLYLYEAGFFSNYLQLLSLWQKRRSKLLAEQTDAAYLSVTPALVSDGVVFPMGMFVPPLFHPTYPVWAHYLNASENSGQVEASVLSEGQQQELWLQYSALQVALQ